MKSERVSKEVSVEQASIKSLPRTFEASRFMGLSLSKLKEKLNETRRAYFDTLERYNDAQNSLARLQGEADNRPSSKNEYTGSVEESMRLTEDELVESNSPESMQRLAKRLRELKAGKDASEDGEITRAMLRQDIDELRALIKQAEQSDEIPVEIDDSEAA